MPGHKKKQTQRKAPGRAVVSLPGKKGTSLAALQARYRCADVTARANFTTMFRMRMKEVVDLLERADACYAACAETIEQTLDEAREDVRKFAAAHVEGDPGVATQPLVATSLAKVDVFRASIQHLLGHARAAMETAPEQLLAEENAAMMDAIKETDARYDAQPGSQDDDQYDAQLDTQVDAQ